MSQTDIFAGTMAEMTWTEVDTAARDNAVLLWPIGVIEQHGPHLPTGTDVYIPTARARGVRDALADRGISSVVVPPYYWGVNVVSGSFPASYSIRPELMRQVLAELLAGFVRDGFQRIFCFSGHGDAVHNTTIYESVGLAAELTGANISFVVDTALAERLGLDSADPSLTVHEVVDPVLPAALPAVRTSPDGQRFGDVHAGRWETSVMMQTAPALVRDDIRRQLPATDHGPDQLAVWRNGYDDARSTTPDGYFGDPAGATAEEGALVQKMSVDVAASAIEARLHARADETD